MAMLLRYALVITGLGTALAISPHTGPVKKVRSRRYAPARNHHELLQDALVPSHYDLTIRPDIYKDDPANFTFDGRVSIHFECRRSTNRIQLHSADLDIDEGSIELTGGQGDLKVTSVQNHKERSFITFRLSRRLKRGQKYMMGLSFKGVLVINMVGLYLTFYKKENVTHYMTITQGEPNKARRWFPCFDEPALKATFNVTVLRKASHVAISNGPLLRTEKRAEGWLADTFATTPIMTTYLLAIAVTDYKYKEGKTKDGIKIRVWWIDDQLNAADTALETAIKATEWLTKYTGIPYAMSKMDHIAVPHFANGGMENWGLITYSQQVLIYDKKVDGYQTWTNVQKTVVHEVAHQWFGNLVTAKWWNDIWINEAFTSYMTQRCLKEISIFDTDVDLVLTRAQAFAVDSLHTSHPIDYSVVRQSELEYVFDPIAYDKGALVLRMLHSVIGEKVFQYGIRNFLNKHQFANADQYDVYDAFNEALENIGSKDMRYFDVGEFMAPWINQAGYPLVTLMRDGDKLLLNQTRFLKDPNATIPDKFKSNFGGKWIIPLTIVSNVTGKVTQPKTIFMHDSQVELNKELGLGKLADNTWVLGDAGLHGYYGVNYDEKNWLLLAEQLIQDHKVIPMANRAQILIDVPTLISSGKIQLTHSMHLMRYMRKEKEALPWKLFFHHLTEFARTLQSSASYGLFRTYALETVSHKFDDIDWKREFGKNDPGSHVDIQIIKLACEFDYRPCLKKAKELFDARSKMPVPADIRSTVFCTVIKEGSLDLWDEMYKEYQIANTGNDNTLASHLLKGLGCSNVQWVLKRFLERELGGGNAIATFHSVGAHSLGAKVAFKLALERWNDTKALYVLSSLAKNLAEMEDLYLLEDFLKANPAEKNGPNKDDIDFALETLKTNHAFLQTAGKKIMDWLEEVYAG